MDFTKLELDDAEGVERMSAMATEILRDYYDPLLGKEQNDYMLEMFQSEHAIREQLQKGYRYYFVSAENGPAGFIAFYPRGEALYLSKFYLYRSERGKGYSHAMLEFLKNAAAREGLRRIELNVNRHNEALAVYERLGFRKAREEKNDIGSGFYMDDFVLALDL